uniref:C3H1-type domain-containing protein n=1 Tax=Pygocentrus nattereri TaxID=42514 RepID=A0A3B4CLN9_PYGNA
MFAIFCIFFGLSCTSRVNCSFYFKIGACRHGDRCSRLHNKPTFSQTILIQNIYRNPQNSAQTADASRCNDGVAKHFDTFFTFIFLCLFQKYLISQDLFGVCCIGVMRVMQPQVMFRYEEDAEKAVLDLNNRWFNGQPIHAELSPVTDFREACCRQYEMGECTRGGFCNFMHLKPISRELRRELYGRRRKRYGKLWRLISCTTINVETFVICYLMFSVFSILPFIGLFRHRSHSRSRERCSRSHDRGRRGRERRRSRELERSGRF